MSSGSIMKHLLLSGLGAWAGATLLLRLAGHYLLHPGWIATLFLYGISFPATAWIVRWLCSRFKLQREDWPRGAVAILLPTLCLDPFSSAFFPAVFPNIAPELAGVFGGWMLVCCAGGLLGVTFRR